MIYGWSLGPLGARDEDVSLCDDVPLVHDHQLEEHHEARDEVVEVAAAVARSVEVRVLEADVAARTRARGLDVQDQALCMENDSIFTPDNYRVTHPNGKILTLTWFGQFWQLMGSY